MNNQSYPEAGLEGGLRFACLLDGQGAATHMTWAGVWDWEPADGLLWVHLERDDPAAQDWVRVDSWLDPLVAEALLAEDTRPRVETILAYPVNADTHYMLGAPNRRSRVQRRSAPQPRPRSPAMI